MNDCGTNQGIGRMTHFPARHDAFLREAEESSGETNLRACSACGKDFLVVRAWQKQCSPRCRQRTYVQRQSETAVGYTTERETAPFTEVRQHDDPNLSCPNG